MEDVSQQKPVPRLKTGIYMLVAAVVFLLAGIVLGNRSGIEADSHKEARKFEETLQKRERLLKRELRQL